MTLRNTLLIGAAIVALPAALHAQGLMRPKSVAVASNVVVTKAQPATDARIAGLKLPAGFKIAKWAEGLGKPRVIVVAPSGDVYVSDREQGTVTLLKGGERATSQTIVLRKKDVHGLAIQDGRLFYVTVNDIFSAPIRVDGSLSAETRIADKLPDSGQHKNRTIGFGPDGWLYVSVGSTCNDCEESSPESATILRMKPDGSGREIIATGLRNTIGFAWRPGTRELWGWDHGVDWLGDDAQREELNRIEPGKKYGWPYVLGDGQLSLYRDPPPDKGTIEQWDRDSVRPALTYTAHAAGMQIAFYDGAMFPGYRGDVFATMHGSWNRKPPSGYEVVRIRFDGGKPARIEPFLTGFLVKTGSERWDRFARPMGLAVMKDGSLLVGEDQNGIIYRISR